MMVMEWCSEGDMRKNLDQCKTFDDVYRRIIRISKGLSSIHKQGLCHKDLHLGNILHGSHILYISDLGLSGPADKEIIKNNQVVGVLPYIAPEVLNGQSYTQAADIYSLGIIIWAIIVKQQPFCDKDFTDSQFYWDIYQGKRPDIPSWIPDWLTELILNCWKSDPTMRPSAMDITLLLEDMHDIEKIQKGFYNNNLPLADINPVQIHPSAIYHSCVYPTVSQLLSHQESP